MGDTKKLKEIVKNTLNLSVTQSNFTSQWKKTKKSLMTKLKTKKRKKKKVKTKKKLKLKKSKKAMKKLKRRKRRRPLKLNILRKKSSIKLNLYGLGTLTTLLKKNTLSFINL